MVKAVVGANWGDEGKGKITDMLAEKADIIVRFQGGANAGHTIINEHGRFAFHLMPSGVCYDHTTCIIGNGVALDINKFCKELDDIKKAGLNPKLLVSERAQILMPYHILLDEYEEERLGKNAFGSTKSGIAPFFSDKYDLTKHPRYKYLSDADKRNVFDVERYMKRKPAIVKPDEPFDMYELSAKELEPDNNNSTKRKET